MLTVQNLHKSFFDVQAVKDVSFHIQRGSTFALLGTNGAGKSTVIHIITNLLKPDKGKVIFNSKNFQKLIGVVFQEHRLDERLTIEENLLIRAKLHRLDHYQAKKRIHKLLEYTHLLEKRKRLYGQCSGGEKRKVDIIRALLHEPEFLILDEPTTGLDAESRKDIWNLLKSVKKDNTLTILLTTHYIGEVEDVDHVLIMHEGKVEVEGTPNKLRNKYAPTTLVLFPVHVKKLMSKLDDLNYSFHERDQKIFIPLKKRIDALALLKETEPWIQDFSIKEKSLERVFLNITNQLKVR